MENKMIGSMCKLIISQIVGGKVIPISNLVPGQFALCPRCCRFFANTLHAFKLHGVNWILTFDWAIALQKRMRGCSTTYEFLLNPYATPRLSKRTGLETEHDSIDGSLDSWCRMTVNQAAQCHFRLGTNSMRFVQSTFHCLRALSDCAILRPEP